MQPNTSPAAHFPRFPWAFHCSCLFAAYYTTFHSTSSTRSTRSTWFNIPTPLFVSEGFTLLNQFYSSSDSSRRASFRAGFLRVSSTALIEFTTELLLGVLPILGDNRVRLDCHSKLPQYFSHQCCPPPWTNIPPRQFRRELANNLSSFHSQLKPSIVQTFSSPSFLSQCPAHTSHISPQRP